MGVRLENKKGSSEMNCFLCKGDMENGLVTHAVDLNGAIIVVKNVPAKICSQCGEIWYSGAVTKQLEQIVDRISVAAITEVAIVNYSDKAA
jgi:YgiT-type zinc finger domain-containing protein